MRRPVASIRARLKWLPELEGGRKSPPSAGYCTPARFASEYDKWPEEAWSLYISKVLELQCDGKMEAEIKFLMPNAPMHLLSPGSEFELLEGDILVAKGVVVE